MERGLKKGAILKGRDEREKGTFEFPGGVG